LPPLPQSRKQRRLVRYQLVQTTIEFVDLHQTDIFPQQIPQRRVQIPLPVQSPFAARINQPVAHQRLEHIQPARSFTAWPQPFGEQPTRLRI